MQALWLLVLPPRRPFCLQSYRQAIRHLEGPHIPPDKSLLRNHSPFSTPPQFSSLSALKASLWVPNVTRMGGGERRELVFTVPFRAPDGRFRVSHAGLL